MDPRTRLLKALRGEPTDMLAWTTYTVMVPTGAIERELRNRGLTMVQPVAPYTTERPNVEVVTRQLWQGGHQWDFTTYRTPVGEVTEKSRIEGGYGSRWIAEYMIRRPEDYRVVEYMVRDSILSPDYDVVLETERNLGGDGIALAWTSRSPYQQMYIELMGLERLALDRADGLPGFFALREALEEQHERIHEIVAASPAQRRLAARQPLRPRRRRQGLPRLLCALLQPGGRGPSPSRQGDGDAHGRAPGQPRACHRRDGPAGDRSLHAATDGQRRRAGGQSAPGRTRSSGATSPAPSSSSRRTRSRRFTLDFLRRANEGGRFILGITEDIPKGVRNEALLVYADAVAEYRREPHPPASAVARPTPSPKREGGPDG